jgi:hypothetical protein
VILAYAIVLLVVLALLLRRDLSSIGRLSFRGGKKLIVLVVGLYMLQAISVIYASGQGLFQVTILNLSQFALAFLVFLNRHLPGAKVFLLGLILNLAVMVANGGWMPVTQSTYQFLHPGKTSEIGARPPSSKNIVLAREETNFWILSDIIPVILPWRSWAVSIGDVLLIIGATVFIFKTTSTKEKQLPEEQPNNQMTPTE